MRSLRRFGSIAALVCVGAVVATAQIPERRPRLIVLLMVDQMHADYVDKFAHQWSGGLRRLVSSGAWFRQVDYPYFDSVTCAGHTTVGTGVLPWTHGMVMNEWWDRARNREVPCTEDDGASVVSYGKPVTGAGDSARPIRVPTLADELRAQLDPAARVVAFSLKARAAIPLAGRRPEAVAWFHDSGTFVTSTAFTQAPNPIVADFIRRHPIEDDVDKVWDRSLPLSAYLYEDKALGAHVPNGMSAAFPHALGGESRKADRGFYDRWQESPFSDEYLAAMTLAVASAMRLGRTDATDFIGFSFSALDKVGHDYGPHSPEIQDVLVRLDRTLGRFISELDATVGTGNYVVALTGDHGVAPLPDRLLANGVDAGRVDSAAIERAVERTLSGAFGPASYVSHIANGDIYLRPGVLDHLLSQFSVLEAVRRSLLAIPGIQDVLSRDRVAANHFDDDVVGRRLAHSFDAERSGDLLVVTRPYWSIRDAGAGHGSPYGYDTRVPILMMGAGVASGEYLAPASPADIAPTLAFLAGITLPRAEGRVLIEALPHHGDSKPAIQTRK
ncbi:MAG TPA: alkaline phosphatase family protein [Vicinamibacterales bacterium]|nr:alkaline phosphatase family protein [Vicinamibacterales bacterium]